MDNHINLSGHTIIDCSKCHKCDSDICLKCGLYEHNLKEWEDGNINSHPPAMSCKDAFIHQNKINIEQMKKYVLEGKLQKCPNPQCSKFVEKIDGCDHITCPCGQKFCFNCCKVGHECREDCDNERYIPL